MGCTKVVYTYNEFLNNNETTMLDAITGIVLLSMVDIPTALKQVLGKDYKKIISYFELLKKRGKGDIRGGNSTGKPSGNLPKTDSKSGSTP